MGLFKNIARKTYETGSNYALGQSVSSSSVINIFGNGGNNINVLEEYSGYVWKCINVRSEDLAAINFFIERQVNQKWQKDTNHEFNTVLEGVDGGYDLSELLEAHQVCMDMYGESFWYFSKGESSSKPFAVYVLDPAYITVFVAGERVTGYMYNRNDEHILMDLDEIAHYRIHNPQNRYRGAGPMQKAGWFIRSSRYVTTYINNFLENNAIPAGVIVGDASVNDDDWKLFKEAWTSKYSGIDNSGKTGFVRGDLKFEKTGLSLGDVDFEKVKNASRDDILAMFSMPKSKLGLYEDFNKASSVTSDQQFAKSFTQPAVRRITRRLSRKVGVWYGQQFQVGSDFSIPEDRVQRLNEYDRGYGRWYTVNETREAFGMEKLTGKEFDTILPDAPIAPTPTTPTKSLGKITIRKNNKAIFSYEMKETFRSQTENTQIKYEGKAIAELNTVLKDQKERVLNQIAPKKYIDSNFNVQDETKQMEEVLLPIFIQLAKEQGNSALQFVTNNAAEFALTPVIEKYIADSIRKAGKGFNELTQTLVSEAVTDGLTNGDSIAAIAKEIDAIYSDMLGVKEPGYRLERFARTEIIRSSNAVTEQAYKQSGVVHKKEWFANPGHCQYCGSLDGSIINLDSAFVPEGSSIEGTEGGSYKADYGDIEHPGAHPNCRCTIIPVIEG